MRMPIAVGVLALWLGLAGGTAGAAAEAPRDSEARSAREKELEARLKALERRVEEMEQQRTENRIPSFRLPPGTGFGRDMDQMWEQFRNQLENQYGVQPPAWGNRPAQPRPRLGVELAPVTEELAERFKNNAKEGAVVMQVVPGTPADKAGLKRGDVVTAFDEQAIDSPQALIDAVKKAENGKHELTISRHGDSLKLPVELGAKAEGPQAEADEQLGGLLQGGRWLRRGQGPDPQKGNSRTRTEVRSSALELTDALAAKLKLTDDQRKKVSDVLAGQAKALAEDVAGRVQADTARGGVSVDMNDNLGKLADKYVAAAEKELTGVLSADQLKDWKEHARRNRGLSMSYSQEFEGGTDEKEKDGLRNF